jgi:hypothetical protein
MGRPSKYAPEVKERAIRIVREHRPEYPSQWAAITSIAAKLGMTSLRGRPCLRVVCLLTLYLVATASIAAQARSADEQRRLEAIRVGLRSDDPRRVAWAAFDTTADQLAAVREDIALALERFKSTAANATPIPWLLDAAVQAKAAVPATTLRAFWNQQPVQSALLFPYATGNRDETLVKLLAESEGAAWFTAANLLVGHRVDGLAAELVKRVRFHVTVYVTDVPNVVFGDGSGMSIGSTVGGQEPGFPPFPLYRFVPPYHAAARVLLDGPRTVYYQRDVRDTGGWDEYGVNPPTNDEISKYLASITKAAVGLTPLPERAQRTVLWENAGQFQTEIDSIRNPLFRIYQQLVRALVDAGVIMPADALGPDRAVTVQFEDHRRDRSTPLPSVPF